MHKANATPLRAHNPASGAHLRPRTDEHGRSIIPYVCAVKRKPPAITETERVAKSAQAAARLDALLYLSGFLGHGNTPINFRPTADRIAAALNAEYPGEVTIKLKDRNRQRIERVRRMARHRRRGWGRS